MKQFYAYIRVSTAKQGQHGVSLQEQRDAIERFAAKAGLSISRWFEERETAAKRGRPIFMEMLRFVFQFGRIFTVVRPMAFAYVGRHGYKRPRTFGLPPCMATRIQRDNVSGRGSSRFLSTSRALLAPRPPLAAQGRHLSIAA
jgi:hypothetical protein